MKRLLQVTLTKYYRRGHILARIANNPFRIIFLSSIMLFNFKRRRIMDGRGQRSDYSK